MAMKPMMMWMIPLATKPARASTCIAVLFLAVRAALFTESLIALSIAATRAYDREMDEKITEFASSDAPGDRSDRPAVVGGLRCRGALSSSSCSRP